MPADEAPAAAPPTAIGRVLSLVRKLIDYGRQITGTLQQRAVAPGFARFAMPFGTADLAIILARITDGLSRATALEAKLCRQAARGQDLTPPPMRTPAAHRAPPARAVAPPPTQAAPDDPRLARLPTAEQIAAEVRRRPVGAVIADICRDLGIAPGHLDRASWDELSQAIIFYGASLAGFVKGLTQRMFAFDFGEPADPAEPGWSVPSLRLSEPATGPP